MRADDNHPIVTCAQAVIRGHEGRYVLDARGAAILEITILEQPQDEALREALLTLFGLAVILHDELGSVEAARMLLMVLGRVKPALGQLGRDVAALVDNQAAALGDRARQLLGDAPHMSQKLRGAPPAGALSVRALDIAPPRPRKVLLPGEAAPRMAAQASTPAALGKVPGRR